MVPQMVVRCSRCGRELARSAEGATAITATLTQCTCGSNNVGLTMVHEEPKNLHIMPARPMNRRDRRRQAAIARRKPG